MSWFMIFVPNIPRSFRNFRIKRSLLIRDVVTFPGGLASGRPPLWHRAQWRCGGPERRDLLRWRGQAKDFRGVGEAWQDHQVENITQKTEKTWDTMIICMGKNDIYIYVTHTHIYIWFLLPPPASCGTLDFEKDIRFLPASHSHLPPSPFSLILVLLLASFLASRSSLLCSRWLYPHQLMDTANYVWMVNIYGWSNLHFRLFYGFLKRQDSHVAWKSTTSWLIWISQIYYPYSIHN